MWRAVSEQLLPPNGPGIQVTLPAAAATITSPSGHTSAPEALTRKNCNPVTSQLVQHASFLDLEPSKAYTSIGTQDTQPEVRPEVSLASNADQQSASPPHSSPTASQLSPHDVSVTPPPQDASVVSRQGEYRASEAAGPCLIRTEPVVRMPARSEMTLVQGIMCFVLDSCACSQQYSCCV
jgi:hypothetical protein